MKESQNTEWKRSWHDKHLEWVCAFANAQGGTLIIGKNDDGSIHGVERPKKLLEDIPNKIRNHLGLTVDVDLHETPEGDFLELKQAISIAGDAASRKFAKPARKRAFPLRSSTNSKAACE